MGVCKTKIKSSSKKNWSSQRRVVLANAKHTNRWGKSTAYNPKRGGDVECKERTRRTRGATSEEAVGQYVRSEMAQLMPHTRPTGTRHATLDRVRYLGVTGHTDDSNTTQSWKACTELKGSREKIAQGKRKDNENMRKWWEDPTGRNRVQNRTGEDYRKDKKDGAADGWRRKP